jgi:hypothetical protein
MTAYLPCPSPTPPPIKTEKRFIRPAADKRTPPIRGRR